MSENLRRAQLLADEAFRLLMWNPNGDGTTFTSRPMTERERDNAESMTALSLAYSSLAGSETAQDMAELTGKMTGKMTGTDREGMDRTTGDGTFHDPVSGWVQDTGTTGNITLNEERGR